jgi:pimeloyl-ACP methyl ester carboxylesterase
MIEHFEQALPHGITLAGHAAGPRGAPLMLFLHGFPEASFIWKPLLEHFSRPEHGGFRCVAPDLRGFGGSSAPPEAEAYKAHLLIADLLALVAAETGDPQARIDVLVAHDWGGAFAWGLANAKPERIGRLAIINSPHPGTFARELRDSPAPQQASQYMHFLSRSDAEGLLAADDYRRLWPFFINMGGDGWLTEAMRAEYRAVWDRGLTGGCNLYRVTPLKPPLPGEDASAIPQIARERLTVDVPTLVIWALDDKALLPGLLDGLDGYVPRLRILRVPGASHWIIHERPAQVMAAIGDFVR